MVCKPFEGVYCSGDAFLGGKIGELFDKFLCLLAQVFQLFGKLTLVNGFRELSYCICNSVYGFTGRLFKIIVKFISECFQRRMHRCESSREVVAHRVGGLFKRTLRVFQCGIQFVIFLAHTCNELLQGVHLRLSADLGFEEIFLLFCAVFESAVKQSQCLGHALEIALCVPCRYPELVHSCLCGLVRAHEVDEYAVEVRSRLARLFAAIGKQSEQRCRFFERNIQIPQSTAAVYVCFKQTVQFRI